MRIKRSKIGSTLVEVLVSIAILTSTGVLVVGHLFRSPISNKAWTDNYGQELSKIILLTTPIASDTIVTHADVNGIQWETVVKVQKDNEEICYSAVSVRHKSDSTRTLHYCKYGASK
jgi:hypothetical protein